MPAEACLSKTDFRSVQKWKESIANICNDLCSSGACIDNTLLSAQGIVSYSKLPSMTVIQGEVVSGLSMLTSHTAYLLQRHPAHLSQLLQQYIKQQSSDGSAEAAPKAEEAT